MARAIPLSLEECGKSFWWWEVRRAIQTIDAINGTLPDSTHFKLELLRTDHCNVIYVPYCLDDRSDLWRSMFAFAHMNKSRETGDWEGWMSKPTEPEHSLWVCLEKLERDNVLGPRMEVEPGTKDFRYGFPSSDSIHITYGYVMDK